MNWYKCYDEKAGEWVEPSCVTREGFGYWGYCEKGRCKEKAYRETGISVNGRELIEGDKVHCILPHKEIEGIIVFKGVIPALQCEDGHYLVKDLKGDGYRLTRTGHI